MESPLQSLFGCQSAMLVMLYLFHHGELYPAGMARDMRLSCDQVQRQLDKFAFAGFLVSKRVGAKRIYEFNPEQTGIKELKRLLKAFHDALPKDEQRSLFPARERPASRRR